MRKSQTVEEIFQDDLDRLRDITAGCRIDMHEPDEENVSAEFGPTVLKQVIGKSTWYRHPNLDNACAGEDGDMGFWIIKNKVYDDGSQGEERREWFNLANLIALARRAV